MLGRLRWEMGQFDFKSGPSMQWDPKDGREKQNVFKFKRGSDWEYGNEPPDSTGTVGAGRGGS